MWFSGWPHTTKLRSRPRKPPVCPGIPPVLPRCACVFSLCGGVNDRLCWDRSRYFSTPKTQRALAGPVGEYQQRGTLVGLSAVRRPAAERSCARFVCLRDVRASQTHPKIHNAGRLHAVSPRVFHRLGPQVLHMYRGLLTESWRRAPISWTRRSAQSSPVWCFFIEVPSTTFRAPPQRTSTRYLMAIVLRSALNLMSVQRQPVPAGLDVAPIKVRQIQLNGQHRG